MSFGKFAKERIKRLGKNQKDLARELDVSPAYISQIINGKKNPPDLGRPKYRVHLEKWSRFLEAPPQTILELVRYELHSVPLKPPAKFPGMRDWLVKRLSPRSVGLAEEIRSIAFHPAENRAIHALIQIYLMLQEDENELRGNASTRFREFSVRAQAQAGFVEQDLLTFCRDRALTWTWDPDSSDVHIVTDDPDIRGAMDRLENVLSHRPGPYRRTVPIVGHVSAGAGFGYTDGGYTAGDGFEQVDIPPGVEASLAEVMYCVRVRGDSLREFFGDGTLLFVKPESWEQIRDGDLVIFKDRKDRKAFVKKVEFAGANLILKSMNPLYKNQVLKRSDLALLERVMAIVL